MAQRGLSGEQHALLYLSWRSVKTGIPTRIMFIRKKNIFPEFNLAIGFQKEPEKAFHWSGQLCGIHSVLANYGKISCTIICTKSTKVIMAARVVIGIFHFFVAPFAGFPLPPLPLLGEEKRGQVACRWEVWWGPRAGDEAGVRLPWALQNS